MVGVLKKMRIRCLIFKLANISYSVGIYETFNHVSALYSKMLTHISIFLNLKLIVSNSVTLDCHRTYFSLVKKLISRDYRLFFENQFLMQVAYFYALDAEDI